MERKAWQRGTAQIPAGQGTGECWHSAHTLCSSSYSIWDPSLWNGAIQHLGQVFSSQLALSGSTLTAIPRGVLG